MKKIDSSLTRQSFFFVIGVLYLITLKLVVVLNSFLILEIFLPSVDSSNVISGFYSIYD